MGSLQNKTELLAPAGSFRGFIGALNGGADAFYLAGNRFGARAYADNFSEDEIKEALFLAKIFDKKIYLTVNTLFKNKEMDELFDYLKPFYDMGLTGVIVQDFGVMAFVKEHFPDLEIHASTQMSVTSVEGAKYLTQNGVKRVVLARELTLKEVKAVVQAGVETECFIHGSMCYCYSGQCLFSSLLGGRSGNRGRCAQPCRLPYELSKDQKEAYCLSLKDMCTLEYLPALLESGITSFKIEGRMKNPAYAAKVTQIYRKYIDRYFMGKSDEYRVEKKDLEILKSLYIRTDLQEGYYQQVRGKNMITPESPAYSKTDEDLVAGITEELINTKPVKEISGYAEFIVGQPAKFSLILEVESKESYCISVLGDVVQEAQKAPLTKENIAEKLSKTGDSYFVITNLELTVDNNIFMPIKSLNELRRKAVEALCEEIKCTMAKERTCGISERVIRSKTKNDNAGKAFLTAFVEKTEQFDAVLCAEYIKRVVVPYYWMAGENASFIRSGCKKANKELFLSLPAVCRNQSYQKIGIILDSAYGNEACEGVYVNQVDSMAYIKENFPGLKCIGDLNLYGMNQKASAWLMERINGYTLPVELNKDELRHQADCGSELILYGRTPLMHTANCLFLTAGKCQKGQNPVDGRLKDRKNMNFLYKGHCEEEICYNTIYNSVVTSLHKQKSRIDEIPCRCYQLRFTFENMAETKEVLNLFYDFSRNGIEKDISFPYTNGHFMRGVQ